MGDIVNLADHRKAKAAGSISELETNAIESILRDWEKMAKTNRLNDYFKGSVPHLIDGKNDSINFMSDLNEIAVIESNLEVYPVVYGPGNISKKQHAWVVSSMLGQEKITTPELFTEAYARCFHILMFVRVKREALEKGLLK